MGNKNLVLILIIMAKGNRIHRKKSAFQKGHKHFYQLNKSDDINKPPSTCFPRRIIRLTPETQQRVENSPVGAPVSTADPECPLLLRPKSRSRTAPELSNEEYRFLAPEKVLELFNKCNIEHKEYCCYGQLVIIMLCHNAPCTCLLS